MGADPGSTTTPGAICFAPGIESARWKETGSKARTDDDERAARSAFRIASNELREYASCSGCPVIVGREARKSSGVPRNTCTRPAAPGGTTPRRSFRYRMTPDRRGRAAIVHHHDERRSRRRPGQRDRGLRGRRPARRRSRAAVRPAIATRPAPGRARRRWRPRRATRRRAAAATSRRAPTPASRGSARQVAASRWPGDGGPGERAAPRRRRPPTTHAIAAPQRNRARSVRHAAPASRAAEQRRRRQPEHDEHPVPGEVVGQLPHVRRAQERAASGARAGSRRAR